MSNTNVVIGSISFPVGSTANILGNYSVAHLADFIVSGAVDYDQSFMDTAMLGYLSDTWLVTAAREQGTTIDSAVFFATVASIGITKSDLKQVAISFDAPPKGGFSVGITRPTGDYGYAQFLYAQGAADLIHISFQKSKLVPPRPGCTGVNLWFRERLSGSYVTIYNGSPPAPFTCDGSNPVSPSTNQMAGLGNFGIERSVNNLQTTDGGTFTFPVVNSGISTTTMNVEACIDITTTFANGPFYSAQIAYLVEMWQDVVAPTIGTDGGPYSIDPGENLQNATRAFMKSGSLVVAPPGGTHPELVWRCGIPIYGSWAAMYGDYMGPLHSINRITSQLVPDSRNCTGFWIYLKPGCVGILNTQEADNWTNGTSNPAGNVILAQGQTDGLTWDV